VEVRGYRVSLLDHVPVADDVDGALVIAGARCLVALGDGFDQTDGVVVCVY
jgi:hypothetical protein